MTVFNAWIKHHGQEIKTGKDSPHSAILRVFGKDVLPFLGKRAIHEIRRHDLLEVIGKIKRRKALTVARMVRSWLNRIYRFALVKVPGLEYNYASDLDVVAVPQNPVRHHPFLRLAELPELLRSLREYPGMERPTRLGLRLLLLTGVRTGELRSATPEQFDLERGLWIIPSGSVKQLQRKMRKTGEDIPPYLVPLSTQAMVIVRELLQEAKSSQSYLLRHRNHPGKSVSAPILNEALKRMGYARRLTGHGIRGTLSTALNEIGYPAAWIEAQLSHSDPNQVRGAYNHTEYVEQRQRMMQDWADRRWPGARTTRPGQPAFGRSGKHPGKTGDAGACGAAVCPGCCLLTHGNTGTTPPRRNHVGDRFMLKKFPSCPSPHPVLPVRAQDGDYWAADRRTGISGL